MPNPLVILETLYGMISPEKVQLFEQLAPIKSNYVAIVLEHIYQHHNASAIMRSCESFGFQQLHVIEKDRQYKVQRDIARGAGRWIELHHHIDQQPTISCLQALKNKGYRIVATSPDATSFTINRLPIDRPIALIFGSEGEGISMDAMQLADERIHIPMYGFTQSLNVSVAAALCMYELRSRLEQSDLRWRLSPQQQTALKIEWCKRIIPHGQKVFAEILRRFQE